MTAEEDVIRTRFLGGQETTGLLSANLSLDLNLLLGNPVKSWQRVYSASDAVTVTAPQGLSSLLGKYNDDPTWEGFADFLADYRREIDRLNE
jgi:hypothetical protein